jgi:hypothetical protein
MRGAVAVSFDRVRSCGADVLDVALCSGITTPWSLAGERTKGVVSFLEHWMAPGIERRQGGMMCRPVSCVWP